MKTYSRVNRLIAVITTAILITVSFPFSVYADISQVSDTDVAYAVTGGNIYFDKSTGTVTGCDAAVTEAVIPDTIDGVYVKKIGHDAFYNCKSITKVQLPIYLEKIDSCAFMLCSGITEITLPESVEEIYANAFGGCKLNQIIIPKNVEIISGYAFGDVKSIYIDSENPNFYLYNGAIYSTDNKLVMYPADRADTSYEIKPGTTEIGEKAFYCCRNLIDISIPDSVTQIGQEAFYNCKETVSKSV